jgi:hypothetical protein
MAHLGSHWADRAGKFIPPRLETNSALIQVLTEFGLEDTR